MNPISRDVAIKFCELCNWAFECWLTHKRLFDNNEAREQTIGKVKYFTSRLSIISQEYSLLQISKLHDPAIQRNSLCLTVDYMVRFGDWGAEEPYVKSLERQLSDLYDRVRLARNKVLAHNDLEVLMSDAVVGDFPAGLDDQYFSALQEFANAVYSKWVGGPYPFNNLAGNDADGFLSILARA